MFDFPEFDKERFFIRLFTTLNILVFEWKELKDEIDKPKNIVYFGNRAFEYKQIFRFCSEIYKHKNHHWPSRRELIDWMEGVLKFLEDNKKIVRGRFKDDTILFPNFEWCFLFLEERYEVLQSYYKMKREKSRGLCESEASDA